MSQSKFDVDAIRDESHLDDLLSEPSDAAINAMQRISGDVLLLGAAGKMGPSLARMLVKAAQRARQSRRIMAVSRFSEPNSQADLNAFNIETFRGDLLDEDFLATLPDAENVIFMTGMKFGSQQDSCMTWGMNVFLPTQVCRRFRKSRILAFSTGNVYPYVTPDSGGSIEEDALLPVGEYGMSALGRERMFEFCSRQYLIPVSIVRLNYAVEMRYGVLTDLGGQVFRGEPVDLSMGHANVIWQADANSMAIAALADADSPAMIINVAGPEIFSVREVCERFGRHFGCEPSFTGEPAETALLNNGTQAHQRYGRPRVSLEKLVQWIANWLEDGQPVWEKPTHFQSRSGKF